ncbi:CapA family protein [Natrialba sp. PRR66]|uniref:CapA family protein n=1 Tax=Natrialba sp. PRR66 TaxID=3098146 RepID=UPI002B1E7ED0|nr:CapA family protein [Natrialba sp. PRR66]
MTHNRRAFLTAVGAVAGGGCTTPRGDSSESKKQDSPDDTDSDSRTTIGFGGDTMLGRDLNAIYGSSDIDPAAVWGDLQPRLESLDGVCCNLECCLSTRGERYPNRSYYFRGDPAWAVPALQAGNVQFASLANNHAMDYGEVALLDTIDALEDGGINVAGGGATPDEAHAPATFTVGDVDIAVISVADHPWGYAATDDSAGTSFARTDLDNDDTQRIVRDMINRAQSLDPDLLIASIHWGWNWKEVPNDELRAFGHWLVDLGVDLVHGHSAHVVQAIERYDDGVILHDTGDLVDDFGIKGDLRNDRSFLFEVTLEDAQIDEIRLVPIEIDNGVNLAGDEVAAWLRETIRERSGDFGTTYERDESELVVRL